MHCDKILQIKEATLIGTMTDGIVLYIGIKIDNVVFVIAGGPAT